MNLAHPCYPLVLLALCAAPLLAADTDSSLVEELENAETSREQHDILDVIAARSAATPFTTELTDRLVAELMSKDTHQYHHIMRSLPKLAGEGGFSEQSLLILAAALSGDMTRNWDPATSIAKILSSVHEDTGLSDEAFTELIKALDHLAMLNRSAAIEVLAATRPEDVRHDKAVKSVHAALATNDHQHTRSSAIAALTRLTQDQAVSPDVLQGLVQSALSDSYMTVRMDALELLAHRDIDDATRTSLSMSLASEMVAPTPELWANSRGIREHETLNDRAVIVLANLYVPPYPDHVIGAWIAQTRTYKPQKSLEALRSVYVRDGLSDEQINELVDIAEKHRRATEREMVYAMLFVELQAGTLMDALIGFESADYETSRIRAGYALKQQYYGKEVPDRVADVAARVAIAGSNAELRAIAASLLINTQGDQTQSEQQLIAALKRHPEDYDIYSAIVDFYGPNGAEDLVTRYANDAMLSVTFRRHIIQELGKQTPTDAGLSPGAENTLKEVARHADDYYLVQYAGDTLKAWGVTPPLRVALQNHGNQSKALFAVLIGLVITNFSAAVVGLIGVFKLPLQSETRRPAAVRAAIFIAWLSLTAGMLVLLGGGVIGFLGHNSAPKPQATLLWNLPAYGGTVVYVFLTWLLWRRVRMAKNAEIDSASSGGY
jgi:hypothetical protein